MLVEEQKLRWCGIDMRARWRRRLAIVLTYAVFLLFVWSPSARVYGLVWSLTMFSILLNVWPVLADIEAWMKRLVKAFLFLALCFYAYHAWHAWFWPRTEATFTGSAFALMLLLSRSVLGWNLLVDNGNRGWMAQAIRKGDAAWGWEKRRLARSGFAMGLEGFAWYEYTLKFHQLTEEQKTEIEAMYRANPRGKWMRQRAGVLFDDERLRNEEAQLRARVQRVMNWMLVGTAVIASIVLADGGTVRASVVVSSLWTLAALVTTLRQAIPVWGEEDPRMAAGEIAVIDAAHA